jgi:succinoglycan biosynthesis transport protein ExoP
MSSASTPAAIAEIAPRGPDPWRATLSAVGASVRRRWGVIVLCGMLGAGAGIGLKVLFPPKYSATSQLLFDPKGLRIFNNDLTQGHHDANAAINFVESQMAVLQSERVLTGAIDLMCDSGTGADGKPSGVPGLKWLCPNRASLDSWARSFDFLRRMLVIKRMERSFVVDITGIGRSPELAAALSNTIVKAYMAEDARTRAEAATRLTTELSGRLDSLRLSLKVAEANADSYRRDKNLIRVHDKLLVEQRLAAATAAMNDSQSRVDKATARVKQIEGAARAPSALGALGAEADTRTLLALIERRNAVMVELAPLAARAGARHPGLIEVRSRLSEIDRSIGVEMSAIRLAARADLERVRSEQTNLAATVAELSTNVTKARQSEIALRALEQEVDAARKLVESFETRSREAAEFGRIDSGNLRVVSVARAPESQRLMPKLLVWGAAGAGVGILLALAGIMGFAMLGRTRTAGRGEGDSRGDGGAAINPAYAMQLRVKAFAQYKYG